MRLLAVFLVLFVLFQMAESRIPAGCTVMQCKSSKGPSECPAGYLHFKHKRCGAFFLKKQEVCCPSAPNSAPAGQPGSYPEQAPVDYQG
ncbi:unnamed protein product [Caenorhabditis sp. 36 PRJEB53466]|nr:unnamed protein product [Caenorhabditis sp. 36 PRJEB53466]